MKLVLSKILIIYIFHMFIHKIMCHDVNPFGIEIRMRLSIIYPQNNRTL